jgi:hypothetical protein
MKTRLFAGAALMLGMLLTGCGANGRVMVARTPPPPPRYGIIGVAPGVGYVWTDGYWDWRGGRWYWVEGRWLRPPRPHAVWIPGHWVENRRGHRRFEPGHWRR